MEKPLRHPSAMRCFALPLLLGVAACATPATDGAPAAAGQTSIEGRVVSIDTGPWAYDGNAVVTVDTSAGRVAVQLPARWNLCQAQPPDDLQALRPGDRVQAVGTTTSPGELVVCEQPQHLLRKME